MPAHYVSEDETTCREVVDTDGLADMFRAQLGHILARLLLESCPGLADSEALGVWRTGTDREIDYTRPRMAEDPDA
jgi:hypothetical protein